MSRFREAVMSRVQLALNVDDLAESIAFYSKLFGTGPAKQRPGYANFAIAEPPLKLILLENPGQGGSLNHLGVEVADTGTVDAEQTRLAEAGLAAVEERDTTCCYARQDKFWVKGAPSGEQWEIYTVLADSATFWGQDAAEAALDTASGGRAAQAGQGSQCCGGQQGGGADGASAGICCA
jgi:catechol 2,3-dioxygenase-like lactoylglutathione lyase family enzyme